MAVIRGNSRDNHLGGTTAPDEIYGYGGDDVLSGGSGNDKIYGGTGHDRISGGDGDDLLTGADGNDRLSGGDGDDTIYGGDGNDRLNGGRGQDYLVGGTGADVFDYDNAHADSRPGGWGYDQIYDFSRSEGDKIDLSTIDGNRSQAGNQALRWVGDADYTGRGIGSVSVIYDNGNAYVLVDTDGDSVNDFGITLYDTGRLYGSDFFL